MPKRVAVVALVVLAFVAVRFAAADSEYTAATMGHLEASTGVVLPDWYVDFPWLAVGLEGDGLVFVTQTVDPFGFDGHSTRFLSPGYRFTRVGYPLAAKAVTLGVDDLAPVGLFVVSVAGVAMAAWAAERLSRRVGPAAWLLVANPSMLLGFLAGTAEPFGIGLASVAIVSRSAWAATAVAMVRPSLLVALAGRWRLVAVGGAVAVGMRLIAGQLFGRVEGAHVFAAPFVDYVRHGSPEAWVLVGIATVVCVVGVFRRDWAWVLSGLMVLCFSEPVIEFPVNAWRTAGSLWLVVASSGRLGDPEILDGQDPVFGVVAPVGPGETVVGGGESERLVAVDGKPGDPVV